jgi:hypothetical protein
MDLNVKLQGLKHNFRKVQGGFCSISGVRLFSRISEATEILARGHHPRGE